VDVFLKLGVVASVIRLYFIKIINYCALKLIVPNWNRSVVKQRRKGQRRHLLIQRKRCIVQFTST